MNTTIYLIRHSETLKNCQTIKKIDNILTENIKSCLSIEGEEKAKEYFLSEEFNNIDAVYSSNYVRAISTAKYIAAYNNINLNIRDNFNERIHGINDWQELPSNFELNQMQDELYKIGYGESQKEVKERMLEGINEILDEHKGKRVAIVSHATAITFLLSVWCQINYLDNYIFNNQIFFDGKFNYLETFKLIFDKNNKLIDVTNIKP